MAKVARRSGGHRGVLVGGLQHTRRLAVGIAVAFMLFVTACGGGGDDGGDEAEGAEATEVQTGGSVVFGLAAETDGWIPQVNRWVAGVDEPAAMRVYGVPLVQLKIAGSYSCRPMNNAWGAHLSEHGHANALDVSGFVLADGRSISVKRGWRGEERDRAFLRLVRAGACQHFTTVLSPDYDSNHHDHFHVDLARRGSDGLKSVCK